MTDKIPLSDSDVSEIYTGFSWIFEPLYLKKKNAYLEVLGSVETTKLGAPLRGLSQNFILKSAIAEFIKYLVSDETRPSLGIKKINYEKMANQVLDFSRDIGYNTTDDDSKCVPLGVVYASMMAAEELRKKKRPQDKSYKFAEEKTKTLTESYRKMISNRPVSYEDKLNYAINNKGTFDEADKEKYIEQKVNEYELKMFNQLTGVVEDAENSIGTRRSAMSDMADGIATQLSLYHTLG